MNFDPSIYTMDHPDLCYLYQALWKIPMVLKGSEVFIFGALATRL